MYQLQWINIPKLFRDNQQTRQCEKIDGFSLFSGIRMLCTKYWLGFWMRLQLCMKLGNNGPSCFKIALLLAKKISCPSVKKGTHLKHWDGSWVLSRWSITLQSLEDIFESVIVFQDDIVSHFALPPAEAYGMNIIKKKALPWWDVGKNKRKNFPARSSLAGVSKGRRE